MAFCIMCSYGSIYAQEVNLLPDQAELSGSYTTAQSYYELILNYNPQDTIVGEKINKIISKSTHDTTNIEIYKKGNRLICPSRIRI